MPGAARVGDMHSCPMSTPATPPVPHVGGPVNPPGCITVLIEGKPAARMGDITAHGGSITVGSFTVIIGG